MRPQVSIILVDYQSKEDIKRCIGSIKVSKPEISYQVIVVDNNKNNVGYGAGCNKGADKAQGDYLFFLNPDTEFVNNALDVLYNILVKNRDIVAVAPLLFDKHFKPYQLQGTLVLTPFNALFAYSFINKYFPWNLVSYKFWLKDWQKKSDRVVGVLPGTAFMISKKDFDLVGRFDERFFLYFEENDFCKRLQAMKRKLIITPRAKVVHYWGRSTDKLSKVKRDRIFIKSRHYYFAKHFGFFGLMVSKIL